MKEASLTKLGIKKAEFYAYHGVKSEEQTLGGKYEIDLDMWYDATAAIINDDVNIALNYEEAMACIEEVINDDSYNLIETIANEILNSVMEKLSNLQKATVWVRKINVPIGHVVSHIEAEQSMLRTK